MKKTLYLHVGTHKTGTTSLQHFLYNSEINGELAKRGFSYPLINSSCNRVQTTETQFINGSFLIEPSYMLKRNFKVLSKHFTKCNSIILSEEFISLLMIYPDYNPWYRNVDVSKNLYLLKKYCDKNNIEIVVILYLRRQDLFIESWHLERIKNKCKTLDVRDSVRMMSNFLDYYSLTSKFKRIFAKMIVRSYENFNKGEVVGDFLKILNIKLNYKKTCLNKKISLNAAYIKTIINSLPLSYNDLNNINYLIMSNNYRKLKRTFLLDKKEASNILDTYKEINSKLKTEFNIDFKSDLSMYKNKYSPLNKYLIDDLVNFLIKSARLRKKSV